MTEIDDHREWIIVIAVLSILLGAWCIGVSLYLRKSYGFAFYAILERAQMLGSVDRLGTRVLLGLLAGGRRMAWGLFGIGVVSLAYAPTILYWPQFRGYVVLAWFCLIAALTTYTLHRGRVVNQQMRGFA